MGFNKSESISDAFSVSNYIIKYYHDNEKPIDLLKLLKLLYICFGYVSLKKEQYLFFDAIEAWALGPVVPEVYFYVKRKIPSGTYEINQMIWPRENTIKELNIKSYIDEVCKYHLDTKSSVLINITHVSNGPWDETFKHPFKRQIDKDEIIEHYKKKFER